MTARDEHPHLAEPLAGGRVRVDMHTHTMWSGDCTTTPEELVEALADAGLDAVCITDHNTVNGALALRDSLPCQVIVGQEVKTSHGEIIGLFLSERLPHGIGYREASARIRDQGGLVYLPHPYDPVRHCLAEEALEALAAEGGLDAMEVLNAKTPLAHLNQKAAATAARLGLPGGAGSDAHVPAALGAAYVEMDAAGLEGPEAFLSALSGARAVGHHWDKARPWRPRIVPATSSFEPR